MSWAAEARHLNLCEPFYTEPSLTEGCLSPSEFWELGEPIDDPNVELAQCGLQKFRDEAANERWEVDRDGMAFLADIATTSDIPLSRDLIASPLWIDIKTAEPILKTDPEMEMLRLRRRHTVSLSRYKRIGFVVEEPCRVKPWSERELSLPRTLTQEINTAKLDIDRPTMEFLHHLSTAAADDGLTFDPCTSEDFDLDQVGSDDYCTSPLVALARSPKLPTLAPAIQEVDFTSTPDDPIAEELASIQQQIGSLDNLEDLHMSCVDDFDTQLTSPSANKAFSSPLGRKRASDLKIETPVTAFSWEDIPGKRRKTTHLPDAVLSLISPLNSADEDEGTLSMQPLTEAAASLGRSAISQVENEQLMESDATMRIEVPTIDMSSPPTPWVSQFGKGELLNGVRAHRNVLSRFKRELLGEIGLWSGMSGAGQSLRKLPFSPRYGEIRSEGDFDDGSFARYLKEMDFDKEPDVDSIIAFDGYLAMCDEDEEEELDLPGFDEDTSAQPNATPLQTDGNAGPSQQPPTAIPWTQIERVPSRKSKNDRILDLSALVKSKMQQLADRSTKASGEQMNYVHSTETNLAKFMQLSGKTHVVQLVAPEVDLDPPKTSEDRVWNETERMQSNFAVPQLVEPDRAIQAIFSKSLFANTALIRQLQNLLPALDMIERRELTDGLKPQQARARNHNHEADITISPSTGVVLTTLQRLNQTGLPGQNSYFGIRDRVAVVSLRYERLIVLVSEGRQQQPQQRGGAEGKVMVATGSLNNRDCENLADLTCCVLGEGSGEMEVHYVPGGGEQLVQWIAACMTQHAVVLSSGGANDNVKLLRDETQWERLLRRAGMNAFAAQAVLGKLKNLASFVELSEDERIAQLEGDFRGKQVLTRVSRVVDEGWKSVAGGHRD